MSTDEPQQCWNDIDKAESHDHLFSSEYAQEIFKYMLEREVCYPNSEELAMRITVIGSALDYTLY